MGVRNLVLVPASGAFGHLILERLAGARVGDVIPFQQGVEQFRVRAIAVVALAVVLEHQFPVGLFHQGGLHGHLGVLHVVGFHVVRQGGEELVDGRRVFRQGDEDVAAGGLALHRFQAVVLEVEVGAHFAAGEQQATVQLVGPLVVGADQLGDLALVRYAQTRAAMTADVMEGVDLPFGAAYDQDRVVADLQGEEVAFGRDFAGHAGDQPFLVENLLHVYLEQALVAVEGLRQGECAVALVQHLRGRLAGRLQRVAQAQVLGAVHGGSSLASASRLPEIVADTVCAARSRSIAAACNGRACLVSGVWSRQQVKPYPWATWPDLFPTRQAPRYRAGRDKHADVAGR